MNIYITAILPKAASRALAVMFRQVKGRNNLAFFCCNDFFATSLEHIISSFFYAFS